MAVLFDLDITLPLAGILLGIMFGLINGVSREETIKQIAISVFGTIIVAFIGISFYAYGFSLEVLLGFLIWSSIGFILTFLVGLAYHRQTYKRDIEVPSLHRPDRWEIGEIEKNPPKIDAELHTISNIFLGYNVEISLNVKNVSDVTLDDLCIFLRISDLKLKEKDKKRFCDLPNLVPNEENEYTISERIGRSLNHAVDLCVERSGVPLGEYHWTVKQLR